jgi:hypothetical protein
LQSADIRKDVASLNLIVVLIGDYFKQHDLLA